MKILLSCLLILMLVDDSSLATYDRFRWQHIHDKMKVGDCDDEMEKINMGKVKNCKDNNTFIVSTEDKVKNICKGKQGEEMTLSTETFRIIFCKLKKKEAMKSKCEYEGSSPPTKKYLKVKCKNNEPVHYHGDRDQPGF